MRRCGRRMFGGLTALPQLQGEGGERQLARVTARHPASAAAQQQAAQGGGDLGYWHSGLLLAPETPLAAVEFRPGLPQSRCMTDAEPRLTSLAHGGGCGCKLAPAALQDILRHVPA